MFDITDPFGRGRIRELEYDLQMQTEEMEQLRKEVNERLTESYKLDSFLVRLLEDSYRKTQELEKRSRELTKVILASNEARVNLGEKNRELSKALELERKRFAELGTKYDQLNEKLNSKRAELEELYAQHEALIREIRDRQHPTENSQDDVTPEELSA